MCRRPARAAEHQRARGLDIADQTRAAREQRRRAGHASSRRRCGLGRFMQISRAIDCALCTSLRASHKRGELSQAATIARSCSMQGEHMRKTICGVMRVSSGALASGCSHEAADWKSASAADTSEAYQQFLQAVSAQRQCRAGAGAHPAAARGARLAGAAAADTRDRLRAVRDAASRQQVGAGGAHPHRELCAGRRHAPSAVADAADNASACPSERDCPTRQSGDEPASRADEWRRQRA